MLTVIGDLLADVIVLAGSAYEIGTDNRAVITHARGGSAANVAAAAAASVGVRFIGRVGDDAEGEALTHRLASAGVEVFVQSRGRTGSIVILVDESAERTMLTDRGAAAELDTIDPLWLESTDWLHLPLYGFVATPSREALMDAAALVQARGVPISVDLSSVAAMRELGVDVLAPILRTLSPAVVFANADEALLAEEIGLAPGVSGTFVVKRGAQPVWVVTAASTVEVPVRAVPDVLDTTGAGDAFAAGYLGAAMAGASAVECAGAGAALAAEALRRPGAL